MFLNRIWGLYTQPKTEWHTVDRQHESLNYCLMHLALIALVPAISAYFSLAHIGLRVGSDGSETILLSSGNALGMALILYVSLIAGAFALAYLIFWMAKTFGASPSFTHSIELAAYAATPLFMSGLALFYPVPIFVMLVGLVGVTYSTYLLHSGIPIVMRIPAERGFIYAMSVITGAWVLLLCAVVAAIMLWSWTFMYIL